MASTILVRLPASVANAVLNTAQVQYILLDNVRLANFCCARHYSGCLSIDSVRSCAGEKSAIVELVNVYRTYA